MTSTRILASAAALVAVFYLWPHPAAAGDEQDGDEGRWQRIDDMPVARMGCHAYLVDGRKAIFLGGLGNGSPPRAELTASIYDLDTKSWTTSAVNPAASPDTIGGWASITAKLGRGRFLVAGGTNAFPDANAPADHRTFIYDARADVWYQAGDIPIGGNVVIDGQLRGTAITLDDGRVFQAGGGNVVEEPQGLSSSVTMVFTPNDDDPCLGTWRFTRNKHDVRTHLHNNYEHVQLVKLDDGRVLIVGGYSHVSFDENGFIAFPNMIGTNAELFDPATNELIELPSPPPIVGEDIDAQGNPLYPGDVTLGVRQQCAIEKMPDGRVLLAGGFSCPVNAQDQLLAPPNYAGAFAYAFDRASAVIFDPRNIGRRGGPWTITRPMSTPRIQAPMYPLEDGGMLVSGGWSDDDFYAGNLGLITSEVYDPWSGRWTDDGPLPSFVTLNHPYGFPDGIISPIMFAFAISGVVFENGKIIEAGASDDLLTPAFPSALAILYRPGSDGDEDRQR